LRKFMDSEDLLTTKQVISVLSVKEQILEACHTYLAETRGIFTLWSERIHASDARTLIKNIEEMEDPQEMLRITIPYIEKLKDEEKEEFFNQLFHKPNSSLQQAVY